MGLWKWPLLARSPFIPEEHVDAAQQKTAWGVVMWSDKDCEDPRSNRDSTATLASVDPGPATASQGYWEGNSSALSPWWKSRTKAQRQQPNFLGVLALNCQPFLSPGQQQDAGGLTQWTATSCCTPFGCHNFAQGLLSPPFSHFSGSRALAVHPLPKLGWGRCGTVKFHVGS